jgi:uncharacterized protein (DUF1800 family)
MMTTNATANTAANAATANTAQASSRLSRRGFFDMMFGNNSEADGNNNTHNADNSSGQKGRGIVQATLETATDPLDRRRALHLLRRTTFAPTPALVASIVGKAPSEAFDILFPLATTAYTTPAAPAASTGAASGAATTWVNTGTEDPDNADNDTRNMIHSTWGTQFGSLQAWWTALMLAERTPAREKIVLFWSGHFTSEFRFDDLYNPPALLYRQNQVIRRDCLGDVRQLAEDMTLDGAMLNYLGGTLNSKGKPNENYARELLELFTTGLGAYTEGDVKEAARALTGWRASRFTDEPRPNGLFTTYFDPNAHDTGAKQFLGVTIPARTQAENTEFLVRRDEVRRLIDIIFQQRSDTASRFLARKMYAFFVYAKPSSADETVIAELAGVLKNSQFQIRSALRALFTSKHFFDEANIGVQIKTPAEFVVGLSRQLGASIGSVAETMRSLEQDLIDPPTVAGWDGYRAWISTKTFPLRSQYAQRLVAALTDQDAVNFVRQFASTANPNAANADALMRSLEEFLLPKPVSAKRHQTYLAALLAGAPDYEWSSILANPASAGSRIKSALQLILRAPDAHLG